MRCFAPRNCLSLLAMIVAVVATMLPPTMAHAGEDAAVIPAVNQVNEKPANPETGVRLASAEEADEPSKSGDAASNEKKTAPVPLSDAERISRLQRAIEKDRAQLEHLAAELRSAEEEFEHAGKVFNKVDEKYKAAEEKLSEARESETEEKVNALTSEFENLKEKWTLCKERFDLSIQTRKGLQQQIAALKEKIDQDAAAFEKLTGKSEPEAPAELPTPTSETKTAPADVQTVKETESSAAPASPKPTPAENSSAHEATATKAEMGPSILPEAPEDRQSVAEVQQARTEVSREEAAVNEAREAVEAIEKRQQSLDKNIELEQQLRDAARKQADNALRVAQEFQEDYRQKSEASAPPEELIKIGQRIQSAEIRLEKARDEVKHRTERLDELQEQRHGLMSDRISALEQAEVRQRVADEARRKLESLENPFSRRNLTHWVLRHSPNVLIILLGFLVLRLVVRVICRRVVVLMTHKGSGSRKERENRAETIVSVFHNAATVLCYAGSTLMILEECGVPVGPLLGGAAVFGLAVAFGSQNLIRDYFYGFVILLENQYGINDVVKIGEITGQVERITLRMTVIRDMDGVNFIPNGRIESVKNLTHGWSRAVLDIGVSYNEDIDRVMDVLLDLGRELRKDPRFADAILDDPTMLGVEQLGDSSVVIKFFIKTRPLEQWNIRREMLRRVKKRFDELAIEIPFPQRVVNHRYLAADSAYPEAADLRRWPDRKSA